MPHPLSTCRDFPNQCISGSTGLARIGFALTAAALLGASPASELLARVDGTSILRYDLDRRVEGHERPKPMVISGNGPYVGMADGWPRLAPAWRLESKKRMLDDLINDRVVELAAKRLGIVVTDAETDDKWAEYAREPQKAVFAGARDDDAVREALRDGLIRKAVLAKVMPAIEKPTEAEMRAEWEANGGRRWRGNDRAKFDALVLPRADFSGAGDDDVDEISAQRRAADDAIAEMLKAHPTRFAERARGIADARFVAAGDWHSLGGMHGLVDRVVLDRKLKIGDVVGPVMGPEGQTIYRIVDRKFREEVTFEDVRDRIAESLSRGAYSRTATKALADLRAQANVECLDSVLCAAPSRPQGNPLAAAPVPAAPPLPAALDASVWEALTKANRCASNDDCAPIGAVCPIACHIAVHRSERDRIVALLARSPPLCHMMCSDAIAPRCVEQRCVDRR